ncbi:hypothetical protein FJ943_15600 [Mesorhizobium sp. B2-3-10]|nr:hypothetical protein FJ943_15600 [Mesorhizobium sp. B2-3-10]
MMLDAINELKLTLRAIQIDLSATRDLAAGAHKRIDVREGKEKGLMVGIAMSGLCGGGVGAAIVKFLPLLFS